MQRSASPTLCSEQAQLDQVTQASPSQILDVSKDGGSVSTGVHIYSILSICCKKGFSANFRQGLMKHWGNQCIIMLALSNVSRVVDRCQREDTGLNACGVFA